MSLNGMPEQFQKACSLADIGHDLHPTSLTFSTLIPECNQLELCYFNRVLYRGCNSCGNMVV